MIMTVEYNEGHGINELDEHIDFMVLKYVKKYKPTNEQFTKYIDEISYGFQLDNSDYEDKYRDKRMITSGDEDNFILTSFGEVVLKRIQRKNMKEWVQVIVPTGALIITTITLVLSTTGYLN